MGIQVSREEIPGIAEYCVKKYCDELALPAKKIAPKVIKDLQEYPYGWDLKKLMGVVKRAIVIAPTSPAITEVSLPPPERSSGVRVEEMALEEIVRKKLDSFLAKWVGYEVIDLHEEVLKRVEKPLIELVLERTGGNQVRAARMLGIHRNTLQQKIKSLEIRVKR